MKPTRAQLTLALIAAALALGMLAILVFLIKWAADDTTNTARIFTVGVIATLVSPVAFSLFQASWRLIRPPSLDLVRRQAIAARQLERELADWQFAESQREQAEATRAEIETYINLRTRSLYLERRFEFWETEARRLYRDLQELLELGHQLDRDLQTELSEEATYVLDRIANTERAPWRWAFDILLTALPWPLNDIVRADATTKK